MTKILIAEDDRPTATALKNILDAEGFDVNVVGNGQEAVDLHETSNPDLLVVDVAMPVKDGLTACREIREKDSRVMILVVTALRSEANTTLGLDAGADDYLTKPFGAREFVARVKSLLRRIDRAETN